MVEQELEEHGRLVLASPDAAAARRGKSSMGHAMQMPTLKPLDSLGSWRDTAAARPERCPRGCWSLASWLASLAAETRMESRGDEIEHSGAGRGWLAAF